MKTAITFFILSICTLYTFGQELTWQNQKFELHNVKASVVSFGGEQVLKVERDLQALPFDVKTFLQQWTNRPM